jgi:Tfp pilus assembly protein FimT
MELMVVVGIIGILSAVAIPNAISWRNGAKFNSAVRTVKVAVERTRMAAVKTNMPAQMDFTDGADSFDTLNWDRDANDFSVKTHALPPGTVLSKSTFGGDRLRFSSRGLPVGTFGGSLFLKSDAGNLCRRIVVSNVGTSRIDDCP